jgi:hypothetical protein
MPSAQPDADPTDDNEKPEGGAPGFSLLFR